MALILNIETTSNNCSVALGKNGKVFATRETTRKNSHASLLTVLIASLLKTSQINFRLLDAVAVSKGPGSYTGLRIGTSSAKGLCFALEKPLIGIDTLQAMALYVKQDHDYYVVMTEAREEEFFMGIYDKDCINTLSPKLFVAGQSPAYHFDETKRVLALGNGSRKYQSLIKAKQLDIYGKQIPLSASNMCSLSEEAYNTKTFEHVAYFVPNYLKNFMPARNKKHL